MGPPRRALAGTPSLHDKPQSESRCTIVGEKAGMQTAMYSAPSGDGVLSAPPLATPDDNRLPCGDLMNTCVALYLELSAENDGDLVKF